MARVGINQLRGTAWNMHNYLKDFKNKLPEGANIQPISCVAEPTIHAAETCFHLLDILASVNHTVGQIRTDLALQTNYFGARKIHSIALLLFPLISFFSRQILGVHFLSTYSTSISSQSISKTCGEWWNRTSSPNLYYQCRGRISDGIPQ